MNKDKCSEQNNIVWHSQTVTHQDRIGLKQQKPVILWFTGLSGSGKSTIANIVETKLLALGKHSYLLDGDNIRYGLNNDLSFSDQDRIENIRRIGEVAKLFIDSGLIVLTAFISPFISDREQVRQLVTKNQFIEIFIDTPLALCEQRDPKGLYKKARAGEIKCFTGIDSVYQQPRNADIHIKTEHHTANACAELIMTTLKSLNYLN